MLWNDYRNSMPRADCCRAQHPVRHGKRQNVRTYIDPHPGIEQQRINDVQDWCPRQVSLREGVQGYGREHIHLRRYWTMERGHTTLPMYEILLLPI